MVWYLLREDQDNLDLGLVAESFIIEARGSLG